MGRERAGTGGVLVVAGDRDTLRLADELAEAASVIDMAVVETVELPAGGVAVLADDAGVVAALALAYRRRCPLWLPCPGDLGSEDHVRSMCLALDRAGLDLLVGPLLQPIPADRGVTPMDLAVKLTVRAMDQLHAAAAAAAGVHTLHDEIAAALAATPAPRSRDGHPARLPAATLPWRDRQPAVRGFAEFLTATCGLPQAAAADVLNACGQRTARGRCWNRRGVGRLLSGQPAAAAQRRSA